MPFVVDIHKKKDGEKWVMKQKTYHLITDIGCSDFDAFRDIFSDVALVHKQDQHVPCIRQ